MPHLYEQSLQKSAEGDQTVIFYTLQMPVDSHCHLEMEDFEDDLDSIVEECQNLGFRYILTVGTEKRYYGRVLEIIRKYPFVYGSMGVHPHVSKDWDESYDFLIKKMASNEKILALGEIGLDFYKNYSPPEKQREVFIHQLELAKSLNLPVIIHSRWAERETLEILDLHYNGKGVIHCFSYGKNAAKKFIERGFYISIPGTITYRNKSELLDVVRYVPTDILLVETDSPFLAPQGKRGSRNTPINVIDVLGKISEIKGMKMHVLDEIMVENFENLFIKR